MTARDVERTVEALAATGLTASADPVEILDEHADAHVAEVDQNRLSGVVVRALAEGTAVASNEVEQKFIALHDEVMAQTMRVEIMAVRVSKLLASAEISHRLLKGAALAHTVYDDPAARSFRAVDVLVPSSEIEDAVQLFTAVGATRARPELRAGYDRRFSKSVTMRLDGVEVDLHRLLSDGPFGVWQKPDDLFMVPRAIRVASTAIPVLDPTDNLIHACYHAALGQVEPALSNLRDIALLAGSTDAPGFDSGRFDQSIDRWRGRAVVARAVRLVANRLGDILPSELSKYDQISVDEDERSALAPYLVEGDSGRFGALAPATLAALPMGERAAYALAVGLPDGSEPVSRLKNLFSKFRS